MLIALPNPDRSFTATLFLPAHGAGGFESLADRRRRARALFAAQFPDALALMPDFERQFTQHPQGQLGTLHCWPWRAPARLLVGDAAHAIVPFHGQGLNCGFEDCVLLADCSAQHADFDARRRANSSARRRPDTDAIAAMAIENYEDMRARVLAPDFAARKQLALELERRFPRALHSALFDGDVPPGDSLRRGAAARRAAGARARRAASGEGRSCDATLAARLAAGRLRTWPSRAAAGTASRRCSRVQRFAPASRNSSASDDAHRRDARCARFSRHSPRRTPGNSTSPVDHGMHAGQLEPRRERQRLAEQPRAADDAQFGRAGAAPRRGQRFAPPRRQAAGRRADASAPGCASPAARDRSSRRCGGPSAWAGPWSAT